MDTSRLEGLLHAALSEFAPAQPTVHPVKDFPYPSPPFFDQDGNVLRYPIIDRITEEMSSIGHFANLDQIHVRDGGTGSRQVPLAFFAASLAARTLEMRDPARAISDLIELINNNKAEAWRVAVLAGLRVDNPIALREDVRLLPFDDLPNSKNKRSLVEDTKTSKCIGLATPSAALIMRSETPDLFVKSEKDPSPLPGRDRRVHRLRDIADCLMLACNSATGIMAEWDHISEPAAPRLSEVIMAISPKVCLSRPVGVPEDFKREEAKRILDHFEAFKGDLDGMRLAVDYLRRARRTILSYEDQAIEIGIAIEVILTHGSGSPQEIAYRLRTRGAWLMGASVEERARISDLIKVLYAMRSEAVHLGRVKHNKKLHGQKVAAFELVGQGAGLVNRMAAAILARGRWPDWEKLVLGD